MTRDARFYGESLLRLRERAGLSRADLAAALDLPDVGIVRAWETFNPDPGQGHGFQPNATELLGLAEALRCAPVDLSTAPVGEALDARCAEHAVRGSERPADERFLVVTFDRGSFAALRAARGLSHEEVAEASRTTTYEVEQVESGDADELAFDVLLRILSVVAEDPVAALASFVSVRQSTPTAHAREKAAATFTLRQKERGGAWLRAHRAAESLTVDDVVRRAGITPEDVESIEHGHVWTLDALTFAAYCRAVNLPMDRAAEVAGLVRPAPRRATAKRPASRAAKPKRRRSARRVA